MSQRGAWGPGGKIESRNSYTPHDLETFLIASSKQNWPMSAGDGTTQSGLTGQKARTSFLE